MTALDGIRVVVADDAGLLRQGVCHVLRAAGADVVAEAADGPQLRSAVASHIPDLMITDIRMPPGGVEGLRTALMIQQELPQVAVLLLSNHAETRYLRQLLADARSGIGYLLKERIADVEEFVVAVAQVASGGTVVDPEITSLLVSRRRGADQLARLTGREISVLNELASGASNAAVGHRLHLSVKTVETHIQRIFAKLDLYDDADANRRVQAVLRYLDAS